MRRILSGYVAITRFACNSHALISSMFYIEHHVDGTISRINGGSRVGRCLYRKWVAKSQPHLMIPVYCLKTPNPLLMAGREENRREEKEREETAWLALLLIALLLASTLVALDPGAHHGAA